MNAGSSPWESDRRIRGLRWLGILPAAVLGGVAAQSLAGVLGRLVVGLLGTPRESSLVHALLLLGHLPAGAGFVVAGAWLAPRNSLTVAFLLAVVSTLFSFLVHIAAQPNPGFVNGLHFVIEAAGAALGAVLIARLRPTQQT